MSETKVTKNEIDNSLYTKLITATRDASTASNVVSYTGVGFKPTSITCLMNVDASVYRSDSMSASDKSCSGIYASAAGVNNNTGLLISYSNQSSWAQNAVLTSYDDDGFTLTWTKIGTPAAGTIKMSFFCNK